ncbi:MAG TPA: AbrB/MazE/SpoVT family DNA-binding domain-containing protein [Bryobacteraceae bacterium]|jgi:antitoxin PrlF|nr:AbrB/MazE/SpoVT family DNA-binding domain-containing protein [Bryobacteraceae bacterium]
MPTSAVTSKGQVTIPKEIRDQLGLKPGDRVGFVKDRTGRISLKAINTDFRSLRGILKSKRTRPLTIREMDEAIARGTCGE